MCGMTNLRRFFTFSFILFGAFFTLFSQDLNLIHRVLDARLQTRLCDSPDQAIAAMDSFRSSLEKEGLLNNSNTEANLIIDNMIALERYNYMYEKNMAGPDLKPFILAQYDKINNFKDSCDDSNFSHWFVLSSGDIINSSMQFLSQATAIKQGLREKEEYDLVVKENPKMAFALINSALWYYFAPAIGGGSRTIAKSYFQRALDCSACDYESYYSRVYLSQVLYDEDDKAQAKKLLDQCDEILPGTNYIAFIRYLNDNNFSLMYYINNRDKVEKKLK